MNTPPGSSLPPGGPRPTGDVPLLSSSEQPGGDPKNVRVLPQDLAELALPVAREAAALIGEYGARGVDVADTKSSDVDIVTLADRAAEELIRARLLAARPDDSVLGEEGDDVVGSTGVRWIVDPID